MLVSKSRLAAMLAKLLDTPGDVEDPEGVLRIASRERANCWHAPLPLDDIRIVYEKMNVLQAVLNCAPSSNLVKYLDEKSAAGLLVSDELRAGHSALFLVMDSQDNSPLLSFLNGMQSPVALVGSRRGRSVIAAPFERFIY